MQNSKEIYKNRFNRNSHKKKSYFFNELLLRRLLLLLLVQFFIALISIFLFSCKRISEKEISETILETTKESTSTEASVKETEETIPPVDTVTPIFIEKKYLDMSMPYATYSVINEGTVTFYKQNENCDEKILTDFYSVIPDFDIKKFKANNRITIAVNAGHGTKGGSRLKTYSHPDFSPKVSGGTTKEGEVLSTAISDGMTFLNGMKEADANLLVATKLKEQLLIAGYSVLMIREDSDLRLDNIARTVLANYYADCHIAIHFDSTDYDKGIFYIVPENNPDYLNMIPLRDNVDNIKKLGKCIINSFKDMDEKIWHDSGTLLGDLTQLSYSTNPSVDIELGDKKTEVTEERATIFAIGIKKGIDAYFLK